MASNVDHPPIFSSSTTPVYHFSPITEAEAHELVAWEYGEPYEMYTCPPEKRAESVREYFLNPAYAYHVMRTDDGTLVGYCTFRGDAQVAGYDYPDDALDVGAGMRPDLTGQGHGAAFMQAILEFARHRFAPRAFRTTVASWNTRALRLTERAGFAPVATFAAPTGTEFTVLRRKA